MAAEGLRGKEICTKWPFQLKIVNWDNFHEHLLENQASFREIEHEIPAHLQQFLLG